MPQRVFWISVGLLALALAIAGVVLPLLPTTPFLLVAAFAFARSSPALHDWLVTHPRFGPPISDWRQHGAVSRRAKVMALIFMALALGLSAAMGVSASIIAVQAAVMVAVAIFLLTRPDGPA